MNKPNLKPVFKKGSITIQEVVNIRRETAYDGHTDTPSEFILANIVHNWLLNNNVRTSEFVRTLICNDEHVFQIAMHGEGK